MCIHNIRVKPGIPVPSMSCLFLVAQFLRGQRKALAESWEETNVDDWLINMARKRDRLSQYISHQ